MTFSARIDGDLIICEIGSDTPLASPVFCASLMAAGEVVEGGWLIHRLAGYLEVRLPALEPGRPHRLVLRHLDRSYRPVNRAWLPLGAYLRHDGGCDALPPLPAGVAPAEWSAPPGPEGLRLVPPPTDWQPAGGTVAPSGIANSDEPLAAVDRLAHATGLGPFLAADGLPLRLIDDSGQPPEGYVLTIAPEGLTLAAGDRAGAFYGGVSLLMLMHTHPGAVPCGTITDRPRFGWRGQHLDCARHFFAPQTLTRLIDLMALLKLNRFHWHFADDEAFRLEVDCLPELWQKTAFRGEGELVPGVFGGGIRSGGSYSKATARALIAHAADRCVEILPEIEVPAHGFGLIAALDGLRDPDETGTEVSIQGYPANVVNPAMPRTWGVLNALVDEVGALFPFGHLHLGADELPPATWDGSPAAAALKAREGLGGRDDLQGWLLERLAARVAANGQRPAAWEEAARGANGGIGNNAILFSWTGQAPGIAAARAGYDIVMCPAQHTYLDMAHTGAADDWGAAWAAFIGLEQTISWSPLPPDAPDIAPSVIGVEATFWGEFTTEDNQLWPMLLPRLLGVATKAWDRAETLDGAGLRALSGALRDVLKPAFGWHDGA
ncbi:MAG: family 20 glycosylhydrolase [Limimaricola sp.]|nr:family 20 glycosylhydrolase [Limimaricola sp.]